MTQLRRSDERDGPPATTADPMLAHLRDPDAIYRRSFAIIDAETDWSALPEVLRPVARRMIHACGMPDLVHDLAWSDDFAAAATGALARGAAVVTDCRMVAEGVIRRHLPAGNQVHAALDLLPADLPVVGTTRSAAAIDAAAGLLDGAVVVIGNAPTALFRLLERCRDGLAQPGAILGLPVGFVGAVEAKLALQALTPAPFLTLHGRRGGSAMAAAALNALAGMVQPGTARR